MLDVTLQPRIILDERDAEELLHVLYRGTRPRLVHTLLCTCGAQADLRTSPAAWNGWRVLPFARCPDCQAKELLVFQASYPLLAEERFLRLVETIGKERDA